VRRAASSRPQERGFRDGRREPRDGVSTPYLEFTYMRLWRKNCRIFIIVAVGILTGACGLLLHRFLKSEKPHIILITLDALRADHLNCYGYVRDTAPFISTLSCGAFTFETVIAPSCTTGPSLAALFSSRLPYSDGICTSQGVFRTGVVTLSEFLKSKGYATYAIVGHDYAASKFGFGRGFDIVDDQFDGLRYADEMTKRGIQLLQGISNARPIFLWMHYREPHSPYSPPGQYAYLFSESTVGGRVALSRKYIIYGKERFLSDDQIDELKRLYDANIRFADDNLKILFDFLGKRGILQKSVVIITADHGESLGEHNIFDHNFLYYGVLRVPLIIRIPGSNGGRVKNPVSTTDIFPTLACMLGDRTVNRQFRGECVFSSRDGTRTLYSEYQDTYSLFKAPFRLYYRRSQDVNRLYNVVDDPLELNDLMPVKSKTFISMKNEMDSFLNRAMPNMLGVADVGGPLLDEAARERMRSLGYAQ
jgi:arylsulfatase A-like enzyme